MQMSTIVEKKMTSLRLNAELYKRVKKLADREHRSFNNYVESLLFREVYPLEPNEETKKAIEEAHLEKPHLKRYDNAEDLFNDLMAD